ncbi:ParB N-terminal domain-containing protein [Plantactinospora sp. WMMB334]|uniref:ParB N-terminal domain-containing protein n=1 Tax=Plantactinospora sp. WMMB334 TaxID=3404119 RepID=UPI003B931B69
MELVEIAALRDGLSPRLDGTSPAHTRQLADLVAMVPPIVVQRASLRVVDGMHRLEAARSRGEHLIPVVYFDGTDEEAFVAAVRLNSVHGMPLSARDRAAAVGRILGAHPHWSDRRIAAVCGVSPKTVAAQRRRSPDHRNRLGVRVGRDGRRHPLSAEKGRRIATEIMRSRPGASLREVAREAGISVGTAMDVRRKLAAENGVVNPAEAGLPSPPVAHAAPAAPVRSNVTVLRPTGKWSSATGQGATLTAEARLERLLHDPSLRYTERGRALLRLASMTLAFIARSDTVAENVPDHCRESLRAIADACADGWQEFGERLAETESVRSAGASTTGLSPARAEAAAR